MTNGTVTAILTLGNATHPSFEAAVQYESGATTIIKARSIVLATGLKDLLPETPGLQENWGQGIYWVSCELPTSAYVRQTNDRSARGAMATSTPTRRWV